MSESSADLLWQNLNRRSFWSIQQQDGFCSPEIFAKMFLDRFQPVNKLLKCVDRILRTFHSVRGQFANFLVYVMFSEEALMNILAVICPYLLCMQHSSVSQSPEHISQAGICSKHLHPKTSALSSQMCLSSCGRHRGAVLFGVRILSILGHTLGRER